MSSVQKNPIQSVASPLEIAKAIGSHFNVGKPGIGINGREKGADRRGEIRLAEDLAERADAVTDTAEITDEAWALHQATEHVRNQGVLSKETEIQFLAIAFQHAILRGYMKGAQSVLDKFAAARKGSTPHPVAVFTDTGDGLGLPVAAHNGVEGDLASEGERPFILSGPLQTEIGATGRTFVVRTSAKPTAERIRDMQVKLGFHPAGYGEPRGIETKQADGAFVTTWSCDRSCD